MPLTTELQSCQVRKQSLWRNNGGTEEEVRNKSFQKVSHNTTLNYLKLSEQIAICSDCKGKGKSLPLPPPPTSTWLTLYQPTFDLSSLPASVLQIRLWVVGLTRSQKPSFSDCSSPVLSLLLGEKRKESHSLFLSDPLGYRASVLRRTN